MGWRKKGDEKEEVKGKETVDMKVELELGCEKGALAIHIHAMTRMRRRGLK